MSPSETRPNLVMINIIQEKAVLAESRRVNVMILHFMKYNNNIAFRPAEEQSKLSIIIHYFAKKNSNN